MKIDNTWKMCAWGHKLHTHHTNAYVQDSMLRAAREHFGMETHWLSDGDAVDFDPHHTLFFAIEGDEHPNQMPIRDDCFYVLHNVHTPHVASLVGSNRRLVYQTYTDDCLQWKTEDVAPCVRFDRNEQHLYMPWATNLLPHEIDQYKTLPSPSNSFTWVGTMGRGCFGNMNELEPFKQACAANGYGFQHFASISDADHIARIREAAFAPAIVGTWQQKVGYIPCRIFKNISYGQMGATNSRRVNELFHNRLIFNEDTRQLFYDMRKYTNEDTRLWLMDYVKNNDTYVNWLGYVIRFANEILGN